MRLGDAQVLALVAGLRVLDAQCARVLEAVFGSARLLHVAHDRNARVARRCALGLLGRRELVLLVQLVILAAGSERQYD